MVKQDECQDPILTPGNLRRFVENLPGRAKHHHEGYFYNANPNNLETEIDEFFRYTEVTVQLQNYRRAFEKEYKQYHPQQIVSLLDQLEQSPQEQRLKSCRHLVYIALGCFTTEPHETKQHRIEHLARNNQSLINAGAFFVIFQKLQQSCDGLENSMNTTVVGTIAEIDLYLTLLYLILETQRLQLSSGSLIEELVNTEPNLIEFLFSLLSKLREKQDTSFPVNKAILLLWKSLLFISGGFEVIKSNTKQLEQSLGLYRDTNKKAIITKCTPQDLFVFQTEITNKYPGYQPPEFPFHVTSPLTIQPSTSLAAAMGYANAVHQIELFYQTLFPPKTAIGAATAAKKHPMQQQLHFIEDSPALALPLTHKGSHVPHSVEEAGQVYLDNLHISLADYQLIEERSNALHRWQRQKKKKNQDIGKENSVLERIYAKMLPNLQNTIIVLLKLLLIAMSPSSSPSSEKNKEESSNKNQAMTLESLEEADVIRDREITSKAVSGILLVLLKWTKSSHILKFEYISQLLVDSGCLLLILKIIGLQELTDLVKTRTNIPYYSFFDYNINRDDDLKHVEEQEYTNHRNMFWAINYLRILQMLTKRKTHRIMLLVQYKSAAILKRIHKIAHPVLEQYVLKLFKSQVPYLGKKWRSQNMKIISAIYLQCKTSLYDDWISKIDAESDVQEGKLQEQHLRILIGVYHSEQYDDTMAPLHDEVNTKNGCIPMGPGFGGYCIYDLDHSIDSGSEDNNNKSMDPSPSTPYPCTDTSSFSPDELAYEINKLYIQEMNSEFNPIPPLTNTEKEPDDTAWQSPPLPKKLTPLTRYTGSETMTYSPTAEPIMQVDEEWQYRDLLARLMDVQEKTTEKWLSQNGEGPYRFKVFDQDVWSASSASDCLDEENMDASK